jgi:integrase
MASIKLRGEYQWQVQIRRKGQKLSKTFYYKQDAEVWARKTESEIDRGIFINTQEAERMTMAELIARYEEDVLPTIKAQTQEKSRLRIINEELGKQIIGAITTSAIIKYRNNRLKSIADNSVNREVTTIKRLLSYAHIDCKIVLPHGVPQIKKLPVDDARERRVTDDEIDAICNNSNSLELKPIIMLALYTAMRRGEISNLLRVNVNLNEPSAKLTETKNGKNRTAPLMPEAADIIKNLPARIDGFVFQMKGRTITQAFERARNRARAKYERECSQKGKEPDPNHLTNLRFHDLRHEATSRLAMKLPNVIELSRVTGHQDLKMLNRYYQISTAELARKLAS